MDRPVRTVKDWRWQRAYSIGMRATRAVAMRTLDWKTRSAAAAAATTPPPVHFARSPDSPKPSSGVRSAVGLAHSVAGSTGHLRAQTSFVRTAALPPSRFAHRPLAPGASAAAAGAADRGWRRRSRRTGPDEDGRRLRVNIASCASRIRRSKVLPGGVRQKRAYQHFNLPITLAADT
jgi:hypothetical protein